MPTNSSGASVSDLESMRRWGEDQARKFREETLLSSKLSQDATRLREALEAIKFVSDNATSDSAGLEDIEQIAVAALAGESVAHRLEPAIYTALDDAWDGLAEARVALARAGRLLAEAGVQDDQLVLAGAALEAAYVRAAQAVAMFTTGDS
jgi:hypothetical protein